MSRDSATAARAFVPCVTQWHLQKGDTAALHYSNAGAWRFSRRWVHQALLLEQARIKKMQHLCQQHLSMSCSFLQSLYWGCHSAAGDSWPIVTHSCVLAGSEGSDIIEATWTRTGQMPWARRWTQG